MQKLFLSLLLSLTLGVLPATRSLAQSGTDTIEGTIRSHMDALQVDDFVRAFTFASPMIQGIFGTPENFGAMVSQGYPMVHHPSAIQMLEQREVSGQLYQRVMVTDQAGTAHMLDYQMIRTNEGWQINGVQLLPSVGVGA